MQTRLGVARKTVAGHVSDPRGHGSCRRRGRGRRSGVRELSTMRLARFGDNMRNVAVTEGDKVEAELRFGVSVNTYGVNDLVEVVDAVADKEIDELVDGVRRHLRRRRRAARRAATGTTRCATARGSRLGLRAFLDRGRLHGVHHELRGPRRAAPAARPRRAAADGRRLRLRRRGRLEDLGHAPHPQGRSPTGCPAARPSWRTTPTTWCPARSRSSARTCSRSAPRSRPASPTLEIHPLGIGGREDPVRLVFDAAPGAGRRPRHLRPRRPLPVRRQRGRGRARRRRRCRNLPVARAVWSRPPTCTRRPSPG